MGRVVMDEASHDLGEARRFEPGPAQEQRAQDRAHREDVRAGVAALAQRLLRRHVERRAEGLPRPREPLSERFETGEPEVHDLDDRLGARGRAAARARVEEHDVRRLEVAVDDAVLVRVLDRPRHLHHDRERVAPVHRPFGRALGERPALQVFEDDEELSARRVLADVMTDDDSRMGEPGRDPRLGEEALLELVASLFRGFEGELDGLDGDGASEDGVLGLVHDAHRAAAQLAPDDVAPVPQGRLAALQDGDKCTRGAGRG